MYDDMDCCPNGHEDFQIKLRCPTCDKVHEVTIRHCGQETYCHGRLTSTEVA